VGSGLTVLIVGAVAAGLIVMLRGFEAVPRVPPPVSVAWTVTLNVPAAVGVPLNTPAEKVSPAGSVDPGATDQLYGVVPPEAASVWLYAWLTVPAGSGLVVEIAGMQSGSFLS
jgi:multidrug efflux pump subunit AcrA (membrane-fusion protein)